MTSLEDFLNLDLSVFNKMFGLTHSISFLNIPTATFWVALLCAIIGAVILSRETSESGGFNYPINLAALFFGAIFANWLLADIPLPLEPRMQVPAVFSAIGMSFTAITILWIVRRG
jgi:hypothetical protein